MGVKMTGSATLLATSAINENILKNGEVLSYITIINPDTAMTLTINEGDPMYIPQGAGFTSSDVPELSKINKAIIAENATNYYWQGLQLNDDAIV